MNYHNIVSGEFRERPNRFIAYVDIDGKTEKVHVKNTGRCKELLVPGAQVYLESCDQENRSTAYDLVAVLKKDKLINVDSQAPNKVVGELLHGGTLFGAPLFVRPETVYHDSRFDFYMETEIEKIFIEVKGVTLEDDLEVRFPDAPSMRAVKHIKELIRAKEEGYRACVIFVIQMEEAAYFTPNEDTHREFAEVLREAAKAGVEIYAFNCRVQPDALTIGERVPILLDRPQKEAKVLKRKLKFDLLTQIPKPLLKWYNANKRVLPWREIPSPYRVWISEIMLQQTRVEAVKPYFERFMEILPNIQSLASAEEETLLKLWEGLGYYNRVRNLQKAAIQIMEEYNGQMPGTYEELLTLKGIGNYTAGAISSIAFGQARPAVDGNVLRVLSRVTLDDRLISDAKVKSAVEQELLTVIPWDTPGDFNQALMELGACICVPNGEPHCDGCPLSGICIAHKNGVELEFPKKTKGKERTVEEKTILVIRSEDKAAIRKREDSGLLAGMYELPSLPGYYTAEEVTVFLAQNGLQTLRITPLEDAKHIFSHKEWHMKGYMVRVDELEKRETGEKTADWLYITPQEVGERYPIPTAFGAYAKYLSIKVGNERFREE